MRSRNCLGFSFCIVALFFASASIRAVADDWRDYYEFTEKFVADLSGVDEVAVTTDNESIRIEPWSENRVAIEMTEKVRAESKDFAREIAEEVKIVSEKRGSRLLIRMDYGRFRNRSGWHDDWNYTGILAVKLPARLALDLNADNGSIKVYGMDGDVDAFADNGSIAVDDCKSDVNVETDNGSVYIGAVGGRVDVQTDNGRVELEDTAGNVEARTDNGSIEAYLADSMRGDVSLTTDNGSITLRLGDERNLHLIARTGGHSKIYLGIPLTLAPGEYRQGFIEGKLGAGTYRISMKTDNGSIRIKD